MAACSQPEHGSVDGLARRQFCIGLLFIWIATASPLAALDHEMLTVHMVQHLLLMTLAPPLILLGTRQKTPVNGLMRRVRR
jgi:putative membrane protein